MNREYLQLAHVYKPDKHGIGGWYASEKLDGMRAYWDGGISRGKLTSQVPYANTAKDFKRLTPPVASGLWSRYGKVIHAPDWFLDKLPENLPLDGELYMGVGRFQDLISCVKRYKADWEEVQYIVFDSPSDYYMFSPGKINNPNCKLVIDSVEIITTNSVTAGTAPTVSFGDSADRDSIRVAVQTTSNSNNSRHIIANNKDAINAGTIISGSVTIASTADTHEGYFLFTGYLMEV